MMAADEKQVSALIRRSEQIKRWEGSDTFLEPCSPKKDNVKVKFQDGCVFLAACSSGDKEEVKKLLRKEADINTANVDGLTALHQACIDDNLEMVEFLVENGADVDVCDNEGWTPLHATASCAFTEIARYLIKHGASVAAVNNDGDLPMDIAENDEMEKLLKEEMDKQGIDADAARCEEEQCMLEDANQWLAEQSVEEMRHPKTGATALHVAAAKGYMKVMSLLLEAGVDVDAEDHDGWTPLHAAAHWGQEEACRLLVEHGCDMLHKNKAGHTALDLAEKDMLKLLEELKENQAALRSKHDTEAEHILTSGGGGKRRSSVTRMSVDQKQNVIQRTSEEERVALASLHPSEDKLPVIHSLAPRAKDEKDTDLTETERKNEKNKQVSNQPLTPTVAPTTCGGWSRPTSVASSSGAELRRGTDNMPKIEEVSETERPTSAPLLISSTSTVVVTPATSVIPSLMGSAATSSSSATTTPTLPPTSATTALTLSPTPATTTTNSASISTSTSGELPPATLVAKPSVTVTKLSDRLSDLPTSDSNVQKSSGRSAIPPTSTSSSSSSGRDLVSRSISVPARLPTQKDLPSSTSSSRTTTATTRPQSMSLTSVGESDPVSAVPLWRQGLRKTGSSSMVHEWMSHQTDGGPLPRSASSPRLALDARLDTLQERLAARRPLSSTGSSATPLTTTATTTTSLTTFTSTSDADSTRTGDRNSYTFGQSFAGFRSTYTGRPGGYVPFHLRQQQREAEEREKQQQHLQQPRDRSTYSGPSSVSSPISSSSSVSSSPSTTNSVFKRSFEPPKRDEETETQRKARAKHARQTRRSTQGVSLEDLEKAEEVLRSNDHTKTTNKDSVDGSTTSHITSTSRNSILDKDNSSGLSRSGSSVGVPSAATTTTTLSTATASTTTTTTSSSLSSALDADVVGTREDRSITSGYRRRALEDRNDSSNQDVPPTRSSYRRAREDRDLNSLSALGSSDVTSSYVPRSQRNSAVLLGDSGSSSSQNLLRSSSLRAGRLRNGDTPDLSSLSSSSSTTTPTPRLDEDAKRDDSSQEKKEEKKEPSAIRARRQRRERRSTGITYDNEDGETSKENKPEEEKKDDNLGSSRYSSRYGSNSEASDRSQRPMSYSEYSRSTGSLDIDYKKKYEDEKSENDRLRRELEDTKKTLLEAKTELDKVMKQRDATRNSDRDKRALERKLSEMEEELKKMELLKADNQRLKDENGALIRVISKLSK